MSQQPDILAEEEQSQNQHGKSLSMRIVEVHFWEKKSLCPLVPPRADEE
jgi:hypothetical protein